MSASQDVTNAQDGFGPSAFKVWARMLLAVLCALSVMVGMVFVLTGAADAATVPVGFQDRQIASGLTSPTALTALPDGRVLAMQQNGVIKVIKGDVMLGTNFWGVPNVDSSNERGCLGITPDPNFATNHFIYIYCTITNGSASNNRVIRVTEANDRMVAGSEVVIFALPNVPSATRWHMGGALKFGVDGKLYIAVGNHEDNPQPVSTANSQNLANPFGKILRINADGTVPSDNPWFNTAGAYKANWNIGHRNPFAFDIQPGTGRMFIGDVGQGTWEEVNNGTAGGNYGWPAFEGPETNAQYDPPFYAYNHSSGGCAITGTVFYNPPVNQFPAAYVGKFLFQDFCQGNIRTLDPTSAVVGNFVTGISFPTNMTISPDGSLYYLARNQQTGNPNPGGGTISKITYTGSQAPRITLNPQSQTIVVGSPVTFTATADGATSLQWQRNGANISGATTASYTINSTVIGDNDARFRMVATNSFGSAFSSEATLTVTTNNFPVASITTPAAGTQFKTGDTINYSGNGTDAEDGTLPASAFTWQVDFQHDSHTHPFIPATTGSKTGSFVVPDFESGMANTWLRMYLTVRDSQGATNTASRDVHPGTQISSLTPVGTPVNGYGPIEKDTSNGESAAGDGRTISIGGIPYPKGLGVHAPADVRYNLGGTCSGDFVSDVGVDDEVGDRGTVAFQVYLDGVLAFDSGTMAGTDARQSVNVSVAGKNELRLVVTDAGDGKSYDHASWGGARVMGCGGSPPVLNVTNLSAKDTANAADWSVQSNVQVGNNVYGDRTYTFTQIPATLLGSKWVRTANDSKTFTGNPTVTFSINIDADVYVALNDSGARPSWVDGTWTDTGTNLDTRESSTQTRTYSIYRKRFTAGTVSLGPWNSTSSMYTVIVK
jgi:glucose/arabinose dehydrogenase